MSQEASSAKILLQASIFEEGIVENVVREIKVGTHSRTLAMIVLVEFTLWRGGKFSRLSKKVMKKRSHKRVCIKTNETPLKCA